MNTTIEYCDGAWYIYTDDVDEGCVGPFSSEAHAHAYAVTRNYL